MNGNEKNPETDKRPVADDAELHRRFRYAIDLFSEAVVGKAEAMMRRQRDEEGNSTEIREASALVIAARRLMEMKDRYEEKLLPPGADADRDEARRQQASAALQRLEELARAHGFLGRDPGRNSEGRGEGSEK
ncbi:MAG: hypothetical protein AB7P23_07165 [Amphiplicatus sp.]